MTTPFRIPLGARLILLVFIALQLMMMLDLFDTRGEPVIQMATGAAGIAALIWIGIAFVRHRKG